MINSKIVGEVCPNDDPYFTRTMYRIGLLRKGMSADKIVDIRKMTYYCICVIIRFTIIAVVYKLRDSIIVKGLVMVGALIGVVNLGGRYGGNQWWSKKFQLLMSCIIVILVILTYLKYVKSWTIPLAMVVSLVGGLLQSFMIRFC
jgi:hypothetical protein